MLLSSEHCVGILVFFIGSNKAFDAADHKRINTKWDPGHKMISHENI